MSWIDNLNAEELQRAYAEWQEAKREIGEEPTLDFQEWLAMERDLEHLSEEE
jgi:hypothetical protein